MEYKENQTKNGFRVLRAGFSRDPEGNTVKMEHVKTGARLFWLDNKAENMVFSITFRTLPEDSTGVFHILEHSVLCGSKRFPIKEPFVELLKSSMNTFLNALTFPDMTMYPVSSRNPRDLMNLTEIYLDAVFAPKVLTDLKRFCQEGWHIDRDESGNPEYRGVVFNEMKGSMSDTETLIDRELASMLFPDTSYGFNSGGDPEAITELTWDRFREKYDSYYHPSNALVYLDGAVPMEQMLPLLDRYFSAYEKRDNIPEFAYQTPKACERTICYELGQEEDEKNKGYLSIARITGSWKDRAQNMARAILCDVLTGSNESILKSAALERELAQDLEMVVDDTGLQSWIAIHAEHVTDGREKDIFSLLQETGEKILRDGLEKKAVEASMNRAVYHLREEEEPQGIGRCIRSMGTWLYGGEPEEALGSQELISTLKEYLNNGTFDQLATDMLLNHENQVTLRALPSRTLGDEKRKRETETIAETLGKMSEKEKDDVFRLAEEIERWQETPDREEDLATLPLLKKEDADIEPEWTETEEVRENGVRILIHRIPCNGVVHLRAYFALTDFSLEELTEASMFAGMLGRLPTRKYNALELYQEIKRYTGSLGFALIPGTKAGNEAECCPCLVGFASALEENAGKAQELLAEVLKNTLTEGQEERIEKMMLQSEMSARQRIVSAGHLIAVKKSLSGYSAEAAVKNALDGDRAVRYIHAFSMNPQGMMGSFLRTAEKMLHSSVCSERMTLSVTSGNDCMPDILSASFSKGTPVADTAEYSEPVCERIGFRIPAQIGFAARGYKLSRCGKEFNGSMWLAGGILTLGYLWNKVRVQGGAYGAGIQIDRTGHLFSYSFRDPTPVKTLCADKGAADYLREFSRRGENLDKYIISALNEMNPLMSPREKGSLADARILTGYTRADNERIRKEVLNTTPEQLEACGEWLDRFAAEGSICVVAHGDALKQCKDMVIADL
ncbi:MAG: insulinase family protein [Clostridia bacterium]|nr:insulinase family protein [Clostridia bacterium]